MRSTREAEGVGRPVRIAAGTVDLEGNLGLPAQPRGLVVFVHGSGSSRHSSRNQLVARRLRRAGFGTLLFDLLTPEEEHIDRVTSEYRFDIDRLAERLIYTTDWLGQQPSTRPLRLGYFGASTGAAAALVAAAQRSNEVGAVVSRGGRPDLAGDALEHVRAPTLLLVGGQDLSVLELNRAAADRLVRTSKQLVVVQGATHLFEEPGALDEVARLASEWFGRYLTRPAYEASSLWW
jgi:dienelactone hydrolase